jgi:very-short-patch-repair endonuclease
MSRDAVIMDLVRRQYGLISRQQALRAGIAKSAIDRRAAAGIWEPIARGVYRLPGAPPGWHQRALALCLAGDGVASHATAGWLWKLSGVSREVPEPIDILIPRGREFLAPGTTVRTTRSWEEKIPFRDQIPVTLLSRTLVDLASVLSEERLELAIDSAFRTYGPKAKTALLHRIKPLDASSWPGLPALRTLMSERDGTKDSALEVLVKQVLWRSSLPRPQHNYAVFNRRGFVAKVDFAWPRQKLALQSHGLHAHLLAGRYRRDQEQQSELQASGWQVLTTTWSEVTRRSNDLVDRLQRTFALCDVRSQQSDPVGPQSTEPRSKGLNREPPVGRGPAESARVALQPPLETGTHVSGSEP